MIISSFSRLIMVNVETRDSIIATVETKQVLVYDRCPSLGDKRRSDTIRGLCSLIPNGLVEFPSIRGISGAQQKYTFDDTLLEGALDYFAVVLNSSSVGASDLLDSVLLGYTEVQRSLSEFIYLGVRPGALYGKDAKIIPTSGGNGHLNRLELKELADYLTSLIIFS